MGFETDATPRRAVAVALSLALVLMVAMAVIAARAERAQRRSVTSVLTGYARLGAEQFARAAELAVDYGWAFPVFRLPADRDAGGSPDQQRIVRTQYGDVPLDELALSFFELSPLVLERAADVQSASGGSGLPAEVLAAGARLASEGWYHALVVHEEGELVRAFVLGQADGAGVDDGSAGASTVRGFEAPAAALHRILRGVREREPALPRVLTDGTDARELLSIRLRSSSGSVLFSDGPAGGVFTGSAAMSPRHGGFEVEAAIPAHAAAHLVLGGVPPSRLPALLAMLVLTALTLASILWVLRRERDLIRARERFVTGASHELRTPLAQIRMFSETLHLDRARTPEERSRYLQALDREARRLSLLIDNLLEFSREGSSREEQGGAPLAPVAVGELLREAADGFAPLARERGATVVIEAPEGLVAMADRDLLRQVLFNLLDNAAKHGPTGQKITLSARALGRGGLEAAGGESVGNVEIAVSDQGPGVAPAHREHVWERFWRAPGTTSTGFGVGLAVVRELVRRQGGEVAVDGARGEGGGARFSVTLQTACRREAADPPGGDG